jgi:threonyl-tRNA synthetase
MKIEKIRHSLSHILAIAVEELYPGTKFGIGPTIENGFYYDFDFKKPFSADDLTKIENKMKQLIKQNIVFKKKLVTKKQAEKIFKDQPYKLILIKEKQKSQKDKLSIYQTDQFIDLCSGPHVKSTKEIDPTSFKLIKTAGAYWQGSEKNPMLTRIYGIGFETKKQLIDYLETQREAEKRDHRLLGQKQELFLFDEEVGAGLPVWQPKGFILRKTIQDYLYQKLSSQGYQWIISPHLGKLDLWKTSGHWNLYRENMYSPIKIDEEEYMIKPMNCPFHIKVFQSKTRSYKDLPIKYAEFGTVYRYERSGTLHGLTRVRGFTQDDAHLWCTEQQIPEQVTNLLKQSLNVFKDFGFKEFEIYLSTRPEKYAGDIKGWQKATKTLKTILEKLELKWQTDPGGGVFYGPKIDIKIKDSLGRLWQCTTIQIDFNLSERFNLNYINEKGEKERSFMIHRALLGSLERFIGVLIEHHAGNFPFWLAPEQAWIIPINKKHNQYAEKIRNELCQAGFRIENKNENETLAKKIRNGEIMKIPYLLIVGDKEIKTKTVSLRQRNKGDLGSINLKQLCQKFLKQQKI